MIQIRANSIAGRPKPNMALEILASLNWRGDPAFFLWLNGKAEFSGRVISEVVSFQKTYWGSSLSMLIQRDGNYQGKLVIPISADAIRFIEEHRQDQDVVISVNMQFSWQEAIPAPNSGKQPQQYFSGQVIGDTVSVQDCIIKRSDWLKRLSEMEWQEYELFEVAKVPFAEDQNLSVALERLQEAQIALRTGDYRGVLARCRAVFESAAKYEAQGDARKGFESLLSRAFPGNDTKQKTVDKIIRTVSEYTHEHGRHEQYPAIYISREEAEFCFSATASILSMLSRLISKKG